ncbi:MAG: glycerol acyltransferase, partial [Candidatus Solibacter sp.]
MRRLLSRIVGLDEIGRIYEALQETGGGPIAERLLEFLAVRYAVTDLDLGRVPPAGPVIVTANHPYGILEGAVLASLLRRIRPDVRFLANGILAAIPE